MNDQSWGAGLTAFAKVAGERLAAFGRTSIAGTVGIRRAAVVLCVTHRRGEKPAVIVIKRAYHGRNAGQWGLPGGRVEEGETAEQAALRELREEIGLSIAPSAVLGRLDDFPAASGFAITPIVAVAEDPGEISPDPGEVHSVHHVDLARLAADDVPGWVPQPDGGELLQLRIAPDMVIHAPTGAILMQFREVVLHGRDTRVAALRQPRWTRR